MVGTGACAAAAAAIKPARIELACTRSGLISLESRASSRVVSPAS
jgi:hypothetical protein